MIYTQQKIYHLQIKFPTTTEEDEAIQKMESFFSSIHGLLFETSLSFIIVGETKSIQIILSCSDERKITAIKSHLSSIEGIGIYDFEEEIFDNLEDQKVKVKEYFLRKDFYCINLSEKHFLGNIIHYISSQNTSKGLIVLTIKAIPSILNIKTFALKKGLNEEELKDLEIKRSTNIYLTKFYSIGDTEFNSSIYSILNSLAKFNYFRSKNISVKNIEKIRSGKINWNMLVTPLFRSHYGSYLNAKELAVLFHPSNVERGNYKGQETVVLEASPEFIEKRDTNILIGESTLKNGKKTHIYFPIANLNTHVYLVGKTGMGKSTFMIQLFTTIAKQKKEKALIMFDPHGSDLIQIAQGLTDWDDVIYFNLAESTKTFTFNPLFSFQTNIKEKDTRLEEIMDIIEDESIKKNKDLGTSIEKLLSFLVATAVHFPDAYYKYLVEKKKVTPERARELVHERQITFPDLSEILKKKSRFTGVFREVFKSYDEDIAHRWLYSLEDYLVNQSILDGLDNRLRFIIKDSLIPLFEGNKFDIVEAIKQKKRILIPLTTQSFGKTSRKIIMKFLIAELWFYAQSLTREEDRQEVILFIDEFQNAQMDIIDTLLSESRKYKIRLVFGNQYFGQLNERIRNSVMGNVSTLFAFNIGNAEEAKYIPPLFRFKVSAEDLATLPPYQAYLRTLNSESNKETAFLSYTTLPLIENENTKTFEDLLELNEKCLDMYGEETYVLKQKHLSKITNPEEYFFESL